MSLFVEVSTHARGDLVERGVEEARKMSGDLLLDPVHGAGAQLPLTAPLVVFVSFCQRNHGNPPPS